MLSRSLLIAKWSVCGPCDREPRSHERPYRGEESVERCANRFSTCPLHGPGNFPCIHLWAHDVDDVHAQLFHQTCSSLKRCPRLFEQFLEKSPRQGAKHATRRHECFQLVSYSTGGVIRF